MAIIHDPHVAPRVRMESPEALFAPDHLVEMPVPAPLYLLSCLRLPLVNTYPKDENGLVVTPYSFQRQELVYPDGSRFVAELSGSQALGVPSIYDLDYLLGTLRLADGLDLAADGSFPEVSYADIIRATRGEDTRNAYATNKVEAVKRALQRWGTSVLRTTIQMDFAEAARSLSEGSAKAVIPAGSPTKRERDTTHWILAYDVETEQFARRSRDLIRSLKLNPAWRTQAETGLAAWINVDAHNALASPIAKGIHLKLVLAAAQGQLPRSHVAPLERWVEELGIQSQEDNNRIAGRFRDAIKSLVAADILHAGEVRSPKRGVYQIALEPGTLPRRTAVARGIGKLDPVRTRVLLWHLVQIGMTAHEARALIGKHGMEVERVLRRIHYERTVKGGTDASGKAITHWSLWATKALKQQWKFDEPEYLGWLERQAIRYADLPARPPRAQAAKQEESAAEPVPAPAPELPSDDLWGRALNDLREEIGEISLRTWFTATWLDEVGEDVVRVGTSNNFAVDWIRGRWGERLEERLSAYLDRPVQLRIVHQSGGALP